MKNYLKKAYNTGILFIFILLVACNNAVSPPTAAVSTRASVSPSNSKYFIISSFADAINLNPLVASDGASHEIIDFVYDRLIDLDEEKNPLPHIVSSWKVSPDGKTWTFTVKKGIKWHDGVPLTAEDIVFTIESMRNPRVNCPYSSRFDLVKKVELLDKYKFRLTLRETYAPFLTLLAYVSPVPKHLLENWDPSDMRNSPISRKPVGTGPYKFVEWASGEHIVLTRNPDYWKEKYHIDGVYFKVVPSQDTQFVQIKTGEIDILDGLTPEQYIQLQKESTNQINLYRYLSSYYCYMGINLKCELFKDKKVRQALAYAINKRVITDKLLKGFATPAYSPIYPTMKKWHNKNVRKYEYDPQKARQLLKQAGWSFNKRKGYYERNGKLFEFTLTTNKGNPVREKMLVIIQQNLREVGIKVTPKILEWSIFLKRVDQGKMDAWILAWGGGSLDPDSITYSNFLSNRTPQQGGHNYSYYSNPQVDELLTKARETMDTEKRKKLYFRFQEIIAEDLPMIFIYYRDNLVAVNKRIIIPKGAEPYEGTVFHHFERWSIEQKLVP